MDLITPSPFDPRRSFLRTLAGGGLLPILPAGTALAQSSDANRVVLPPISAPTEAQPPPPEVADPPSQRVGFAVVGLGRLTLEELMPAFGRTLHCKPVALVSGDRDKALKVARQHGIDEAAVYDYRNFDRIADNPAVQVVFIVLPNSLHAEFTVRAAKAGKHVLCEKPMATTAAECRQMIDACNAAGRQLMIAYRSQYEPRNQAIQKMIREKRFGTLKEFVSTNSQNQGDPNHWRLKRALAGGGPLPDVGVYCINSIRFLTGEEPSEVWGETDRTAGDPRFAEVEEAVRFVLRFPSGFRATCHSSYGAHRAAFYRLMGSDAWLEMDPAYAYRGLRMRMSRLIDGKETVQEPSLPEVDQFAKEMDHMAECVRANRKPYSTGEDGLQDQRIIEAIYASAQSGRWVKVEPPAGAVHGEPPRTAA